MRNLLRGLAVCSSVALLAAFRPAAAAPVQDAGAAAVRPAAAHGPALLQIEFKTIAVLSAGEIRLRQVAQVSPFDKKDGTLAEDAANLSLGSTPLAGNTRIVTKEQVELCLMRAGFDLTRIQWSGAASCAATVRTARITAEQIVQAAKDQVVCLPMFRRQDTRIEVEEMPRDFVVADDGVPLRLSAFAASADQPWGRIRIFVKVMAEDRTLATIPVMLLVTCKQKVVSATKALNRGEIIEQADVEMREILMGPASVPEAYVADIESVIGKTAVRTTPAGTLLTASMVAEPFAVRQGEDVALSLKSPHLEVATRGVAQKDGCIGEMIPVKVFISGKRLNCKVVGAGMVEVPL